MAEGQKDSRQDAGSRQETAQERGTTPAELQGVRKENRSSNLDSLLEGFWGDNRVAGSKGALGVHKHSTGLGAADKRGLLWAAF